MQGLQAMWDLPSEGYCWATAGYMGAIASGQTSCGLLIGAGIAIGLRCGQGKDGIPEEHQDERNKAIGAVARLYQDFLKEFGSTDCKTLSKCDFANPDDRNQYIQDKLWKTTCDVFLGFVMKKCIEMESESKI
ncbi:MAG: C_GCAxxG_C_C family protein [Deltaproteobacteria bacterium]|nr:C_GCAxxG_C_C family protein [Deltaproteobacteria bacterium]MBW2085219.1 C_GCAxxG_C_C family protein [Deltaproteobacteria bacterium]